MKLLYLILQFLAAAIVVSVCFWSILIAFVIVTPVIIYDFMKKENRHLVQ